MSFTIGSYEIVEELGRGGMGVVYKAFEPALQRTVALKMLNDSIAHQPSLVQRFYREARAMAALNDPHVVQIHAVGEHKGAPYFVMEFIDGESVAQRLKRARMPVPEARRFLIQAARGLQAAHERGLIHRDIKPGNLMLTRRDVLKVTDFGIALSEGAGERLTGTGGVVGTPGYLSPEACLGEPLDARTDIFALGIVFFEMLTGRLPFDDKSPFGMMAAVVQAQIPDVSTLNGQVDPATANVLKRMLSRSPLDRQQSCAQLAAELEAIERGSSTLPTMHPPATPVPVGVTMPMRAPTPLPTPLPPPPLVPRQATPPPISGPYPQSSYPPPTPPPPFAPATPAYPSPAYPTAPPGLPPATGQGSRSGLPWVIGGVAALLLAGGLYVAWNVDPEVEAEVGSESSTSDTSGSDSQASDSESANPSTEVSSTALEPLDGTAQDPGERGRELLGTFTGTKGAGRFTLVFTSVDLGQVEGYGLDDGTKSPISGIVSGMRTEIANDGETWNLFDLQLNQLGGQPGHIEITVKSTDKHIDGDGTWTGLDGRHEAMHIEQYKPGEP